MGKRRLALLLASWFYCGYFPVAPGTAGSVCAWGLAWFLGQAWGLPAWCFALAGAALAPVAVWSADLASADLGAKDPSRVVIDEVVGQWLALAPAAADSWTQWGVALALFRAFDIWKPFGIRRLEALPGGRGIVADDAAAGACAMIGVMVVRWIGL